MRNLFHILLAAVTLFASRGYSATEAKNTVLAFYIVSEDKIDDGRFIDTLDFPKLGYIATKPDLVITQLVAVSETVSNSKKMERGKDGKWVEKPLPDRPALDVQILPEDSQKFETLTKQSIGKQVLLMLGDTPLTAPRVNSPISTRSFQLTIGEHGNQKQIEDALKKLVH